MKKIISEEEYIEIVKRIEEIQQERNLLKQMSIKKEYQAHIDLPETFGELIINIKRENSKIDYMINEIMNSFLKKLSLKKERKDYVIANFKEFVNFIMIYNSNKFPSVDQNKSLKYLCTFDSFNEISFDVFELIRRKVANNYLYDYVLSLEQEHQNLIIKKNYYEKQKKKQLKNKK